MNGVMNILAVGWLIGNIESFEKNHRVEAMVFLYEESDEIIFKLRWC